jgi:hypothetical protein
MQRDPIIPSQGVLRLLTLAIAFVVGFPLGPHVSASGPSASVIGSADQKVSYDATKVGERLEARVLPAPFLDRFAPASPSWGPGAIHDADKTLGPGALAYHHRSDSERLPIVKHVPRMERGDPPRT